MDHAEVGAGGHPCSAPQPGWRRGLEMAVVFVTLIVVRKQNMAMAVLPEDPTWRCGWLWSKELSLTCSPAVCCERSALSKANRGNSYGLRVCGSSAMPCRAVLQVCQGWGLTHLSALSSPPAEMERTSLCLERDAKAPPQALHHPAPPPGGMQLGKAKGPSLRGFKRCRSEVLSIVV